MVIIYHHIFSTFILNEIVVAVFFFLFLCFFQLAFFYRVEQLTLLEGMCCCESQVNQYSTFNHYARNSLQAHYKTKNHFSTWPSVLF